MGKKSWWVYVMYLLSYCGFGLFEHFSYVVHFCFFSPLVAVFAVCVSSALSWDAWAVDELGIAGVACCVNSASTSMGWVGCAIVDDVVGICCMLSVWNPAVLAFCLTKTSGICLNNNFPRSSLNCSMASDPSKNDPSGLRLKKIIPIWYFPSHCHQAFR